MAPVLVIVGAPGAGKTTVGGLVADKLGVPLRDTDADVEARAEMSVADIFVQQGEAHFRAMEHLAVIDALVEHGGVLAIGGGAVLDEQTRTSLISSGVPVVWLKVGLADGVARIGMNQARPLMLGNVRGTLLRLLEERAPLYAQVATITIETDGRSAKDVADLAAAAVTK